MSDTSVEDWIGLHEFKRRRGLKSINSVQKAIKTGRVPASAVRRKPNGHIEAVEFHAATAAWDANTDPSQALRSGTVSSQGARSGPPAAGEVSACATDQLPFESPAAGGEKERAAARAESAADAKSNYLDVRTEVERIKAAQAQLEYAAAIGSVVSVDELKKVAGRRYRAIRDQILNIPDRIAAQLAAERDQATVHALLTAELERVLHELSNDARAEAARGAAERMAA